MSIGFNYASFLINFILWQFIFLYRRLVQKLEIRIFENFMFEICSLYNLMALMWVSWNIKLTELGTYLYYLIAVYLHSFYVFFFVFVIWFRSNSLVFLSLLRTRSYHVLHINTNCVTQWQMFCMCHFRWKWRNKKEKKDLYENNENEMNPNFMVE